MSDNIRKFKEVANEVLLEMLKKSFSGVEAHTVRSKETGNLVHANMHLSHRVFLEAGTAEITSLHEDRAGFTIIFDGHEDEYTHTFVYRADDDTLAAALLRTAMMYED